MIFGNFQLVKKRMNMRKIWFRLNQKVFIVVFVQLVEKKSAVALYYVINFNLIINRKIKRKLLNLLNHNAIG
jgi:hypothetical protein